MVPGAISIFRYTLYVPIDYRGNYYNDCLGEVKLGEDQAILQTLISLVTPSSFYQGQVTRFLELLTLWNAEFY